MFFCKQKSNTYQHVINRVAVMVRVKQPFVDWCNRVNGDEQTLDDFKTDTVLGLFAVDESLEMAIEKAEAHYTTIFEHHLLMSSENPDTWPKQITLNMFRKWFELEVHDTLIDLENDGGIKALFKTG